MIMEVKRGQIWDMTGFDDQLFYGLIFLELLSEVILFTE